MSDTLQIYRRDEPRAFALSNAEWTLSFQSQNAERNLSIAEFVPAKEFNGSNFRPLKIQRIYGALGLISLSNHIFLGVVTGCAQVAKVRDGETIQRIHAVEFYCLDSDMFDTKFVDISGNNIDTGHEDIYESTERLPEQENPCSAIKSLLSSGTFYFSSDHDVSLNLQARSKDDYDPEFIDRQFLWNEYLLSSLGNMRSNMQPFRRDALDHGRFLSSIIRGFAETINVSIGANHSGQLTLVSRLSSKRAGTRFNARGIDDDGNVANFVEIETILSTKTWTSAFCQIRGSVPLFWEQTNSGFIGQHKVEVTRSPSATQAAFDKHFANLLEKYGEGIHVVNLLGTATGEALLTGLYRDAISSSDQGSAIRTTEFDFHHEVKNGYEGAASIKPHLRNSSNQYGFFLRSADGVTRQTQTGVFRTNCLDCLDRTNMIQNIISQTNLETVLMNLTIYPASSLWERHGTLWADNGDALSRIYAGTGALKTSFTRKGKMSFAGAIADATKSAARMYINNFQDKGKQEVIDIMLGRLVEQKNVLLFDPIADWVHSEITRRESEWSTRETIEVFVGTYNLNGREGKESLDAWLKPAGAVKAPDIYAIGFQEIVELTPAQIVSADPVKVKNWSDRVLECLDPRNNDKYVLLRTGQLVGAALLIFVKAESLKQIKLVEGSTRKTGLKGMSGNKGGVAIRLEYGATPLCFVNCHFAAGHSNHVERNQDFGTILSGIKFQRGRKISDHHDAVIWLGDFNYRINLPIDNVKASIENRDWSALYSADQLNREMIKGNVFKYYQEKEITFAPTYKFDNGTDDYDTSDRQRIPAWTDRILKKGNIIRQLSYDSAPALRFSDHKPVYATYEIDVRIVNDIQKAAIERELYAKRRSAVEDKASISERDIDSIMGKDLPPASSNESKWWLEHHRSSRTTVTGPPGSKLNPNRPANPWKQGTEPVWVTRDKPVPAKKPMKLSMPGSFPNSPSAAAPPLPRRAESLVSDDATQPPALPSRAKTVSSGPSSSEFHSANKTTTSKPVSSSITTTTRTTSPRVPNPPPPRRSADTSGSTLVGEPGSDGANSISLTPTEQESSVKKSIASQLKQEEVDHFSDDQSSDTGSLSNYKSLVS